MSDLISRAGAIEAVESADPKDREYHYYKHIAAGILSALPSVEAPTGELISRDDAIALLTEIVFDEPPYFDSETLCRLYAEEQINTLPSAEIAETEPIVIRSRTLFPTKDFMEWAKRVKEVNPNAVVLPCDAEYVSAEAVQGEWKDVDNYYRLATCSHCHKVTMFEKWGEYTKPYDFCPNCGVKMHKGGDDE